MRAVVTWGSQPRFTYLGERLDANVGLYYQGSGSSWYDAVNGVFASQGAPGYNGSVDNPFEFMGNNPFMSQLSTGYNSGDFNSGVGLMSGGGSTVPVFAGGGNVLGLAYGGGVVTQLGLADGGGVVSELGLAGDGGSVLCAAPAPGSTDPYNGYDQSKDVESYNCGGLALRTYTRMKLAEVKGELAKRKATELKPGEAAKPGEVKVYLWEYKVTPEDRLGNPLGPSWRDYHVVAGTTDENGNEQPNSYSKNGRRPVTGPDVPSSQKPPTRERSTTDNKQAAPQSTPDGRALYKHRTGYQEHVYSMPE